MEQLNSSGIFEGIAAVSQLGMAIAVSIGVYVAYRQLHVWRDELILRKRSEVAEDLLALSLTVSDELKALRSPFHSIPQEEIGNRNYLYERRYKRFLDKQDLFMQLRDAQVRAEAVIDDLEVSKSVDVLFNVRNRCMTAIDMLANERERETVDEETEKLYKQLRQDMYGIYLEKYDPLGMEQLGAIADLKRMLKPAISFKDA